MTPSPSPSLRVEIGLPGLDVSFTVPPGVTVLFGPSGAGKSRTLSAIAGLVVPERGRIALGDEVWFDARSRVPVHRRRIAYVFQSLALFPHLTALENVAYGIPRGPDRRDRALAMLARMRVGALADRKPGSFSGGEAQRVALARAFALQPRVILLDEPFSALDAAVKAELLEEVGGALRSERVPAIFVTHQPEDAIRLGDRVVFLDHGTVTRTVPMSERPFSPGTTTA